MFYWNWHWFLLFLSAANSIHFVHILFSKICQILWKGWQVTPNLIQSLRNSLWRYGLWPGNEHYVTGYKIACHFFKKQMLLVYTCLPVLDQITCTCFKFWWFVSHVLLWKEPDFPKVSSKTSFLFGTSLKLPAILCAYDNLLLVYTITY